MQAFAGDPSPHEIQRISRGPRTETGNITLKIYDLFSFALHPKNLKIFGDPAQKPATKLYNLDLFSFAYFSFFEKRKVGEK